MTKKKNVYGIRTDTRWHFCAAEVLCPVTIPTALKVGRIDCDVRLCLELSCRAATVANLCGEVQTGVAHRTEVNLLESQVLFDLSARQFKEAEIGRGLFESDSDLSGVGVIQLEDEVPSSCSCLVTLILD